MVYMNNLISFAKSEVSIFIENREQIFMHMDNEEYLEAGAKTVTTTGRALFLTASIAMAVFASAAFLSMIVSSSIPTYVIYAMCSAALYGGYYGISHYENIDQVLIQMATSAANIAKKVKNFALEAKETIFTFGDI